MKSCSRCQKTFTCGAEQGMCWCFELPHLPADVQFINEPVYEGCFCPDCLQELVNQQADIANTAVDSPENRE